MQPTATTLDPGAIGEQSPSVASACWFQWSGFLLAIYATISVVGWRRTLIDTEVWALFHAGRSFGEFMNAVRGDLVHPPLFYVIEWLWVRAVGHTDTAVKTLAFLINVPSFFLFTWLAARVTRRWRLVSFLFFGLYFRIGSTPNQVRMYGLGLLLTIAAMVLWERWHERPSNRSLIAWTFVAVLLVYTHLFGLLTLAGFLVANWLAGPRRRAFTAATVGAALSFLPWLFYVLPVYRSRGLADNLTWVPKQIHVALGILSYGLLGEVEAAQSSRILFAVLAAAINFAVLLLVLRTATRLWPPTAGAHAGRRWFWVAMTLVAVPILT
ncbi:MAG TPA: hypothetical protein VGQ71_07435, partial [Terriglobales bacterium]|nr:hypothetical protein [Terriglobales bacterium]